MNDQNFDNRISITKKGNYVLFEMAFDIFLNLVRMF